MVIYVSVATGMRGLLLLWARDAVAMAIAWARHIGDASERESVYSCSGIAKSRSAFLAKGDNVVSEMAMTGTLTVT